MGLFKPAWMSNNEDKALKAVNSETDNTVLSEIAKKAPSSKAREAAINKIEDCFILLIISDYIKILNTNASIIELVNERIIELIENIDDQSVLYDIVNKAKNSIVVSAVLKKLTDQSILTDIVKNHKDYYVCANAVRKLTDQNILADIAKNINIKYSIRFNAIEKITNIILLEGIADYIPQRPEFVYNSNSNIQYKNVMRYNKEKSEDSAIRDAAKTAIAQISDIEYTLKIALTEPCKTGERARNRLITLGKIELLNKHGLQNKEYQHNFVGEEEPTGPEVYLGNGSSYTEYMGTKTVYRCSVCGDRQD